MSAPGRRRAGGAAGRAWWRTCRRARPRPRTGPPTRSGWRTASSNMVLTPIDQPMSTARSTPKWSMTDSASSTNSSMPTRCGSVGRSEPPVPRWFQETTRTPQSGSSRAGHAHGLGAEAVAQHDGRAVDRAVAGRWSRPAGGCRRRTGRRRSDPGAPSVERGGSRRRCADRPAGYAAAPVERSPRARDAAVPRRPPGGRASAPRDARYVLRRRSSLRPRSRVERGGRDHRVAPRVRARSDWRCVEPSAGGDSDGRSSADEHWTCTTLGAALRRASTACDICVNSAGAGSVRHGLGDAATRAGGADAGDDDAGDRQPLDRREQLAGAPRSRRARRRPARGSSGCRRPPARASAARPSRSCRG